MTLEFLFFDTLIISMRILNPLLKIKQCKYCLLKSPFENAEIYYTK